MQVKTPVQEIMALRDFINSLATINNKVLLPRKIGASQKWYQSGLRHSAEYPYPYTWSSGQFSSGAQYFMPFTALEDATITTLEINCTTAQANATTRLGIYASDSNNDVAAPGRDGGPHFASRAGTVPGVCVPDCRGRLPDENLCVRCAGVADSAC